MQCISSSFDKLRRSQHRRQESASRYARPVPLPAARRVYSQASQPIACLIGSNIPVSRSILVVVLCRVHPTLFHAISQFTKRNQRQEAQPTLLVGHEGLIEWLPRSGELFEIS